MSLCVHSPQFAVPIRTILENVIGYKITFVVHSFYFLYRDYYYYDCLCFSYIRTYLNWHIKCLLKMKIQSECRMITTILHLFFRSILLDDFDRVQCNCNVCETIHTLFTASDSNLSMVPLFLVASNVCVLTGVEQGIELVVVCNLILNMNRRILTNIQWLHCLR